MAVFRSQLHQDIWIEHHCERCWFGTRPGNPCPILDSVILAKTPRKPVQWQRNPRKNATMADAIKCHMETRTPPKFGAERVVADETIELFGVETPATAMDSDHQ